MSKPKVFVNGKLRHNLTVKTLTFTFGDRNMMYWKFNRENLRLPEGDEVEILDDDQVIARTTVRKKDGKIEFVGDGQVQLRWVRPRENQGVPCTIKKRWPTQKAKVLPNPVTVTLEVSPGSAGGGLGF